MIIYAAIIFGALGLIFAIVLAIAGTVFAIKEDPIKTALLASLPGANCGACGFAGCENYAGELLKSEIALDKCTVGQEEVAKKIAQLLGREASVSEPKVAILKCRGSSDKCTNKYNYTGLKDCRTADLLFGGMKSCSYGCIGLDTCVSICQFNAMSSAEGHLPRIDPVKCCGCGLCVEICPKSVLVLIPKSRKIYLTCISHDRSKAVKDSCSIGCIGCGICVKECPYDALAMVDNLPVMDFEKCQECGICVHKCPTKSFIDKTEIRPKAMISDACSGCGKCKEVCLFKSIEGEEGKIYRVIPEKCIGCGLCEKVCEEKAITMVNPSQVLSGINS